MLLVYPRHNPTPNYLTNTREERTFAPMPSRRLMSQVSAQIPNTGLRKRGGVIRGSNGRLNIDEGSFDKINPNPIKNKNGQSGLLKVNRPGGMLSYLDALTCGDRLSLPSSEPTATRRSKLGVTQRLVWETPTTVAPIARASFAGGGADSVPTVTTMTPSQSRILTTLEKRRSLRRAGKHYTSPYQRPGLYDRSAPRSAQSGPINERERYRNVKRDTSGNMGASRKTGSFTGMLMPDNQEDVSQTAHSVNPLDPLPPNNPIEQQRNQYANYKGALREPMSAHKIMILQADPSNLQKMVAGKATQIPKEPHMEIARPH